VGEVGISRCRTPRSARTKRSRHDPQHLPVVGCERNARVRRVQRTAGPSTSPFGRLANRVSTGVRRPVSVRKTIATVVTPDLARIKDEFPHRRFAKWLLKTSRQSPVEIFTVNYDVLLECALEAERVPLFDGFVGSYVTSRNAEHIDPEDR